MYKKFNESARKAAVSAAAALMIGGASVAPAYAATQGSVGSSSTGTSVISVVVSPLARITAIDDVTFGTWSGSGALSATDDVCVWTTGGAFTLADGSNEVSYSVTWDDVAGSSSGASLTAGTGLSGQTSSATSTDCTGGSMTATLGVSIAEGDLSGAPSGNYSGTLTLVIAPE